MASLQAFLSFHSSRTPCAENPLSLPVRTPVKQTKQKMQITNTKSKHKALYKIADNPKAKRA